jgi:hypothetical protein
MSMLPVTVLPRSELGEGKKSWPLKLLGSASE